MNHSLCSVDTLVVGCGVAGLAAARALKTRGVSVAVVEKARGTGGRLSSKRIKDVDGNPVAFDLGCTSFIAETAEFNSFIATCQQQGVVEAWYHTDKLKDGASSAFGNTSFGQTHYVGVPRNSAFTRFMADGLDCYFCHRVESLQRIDGEWQVRIYDSENDTFKVAYASRIVLAVPPQQAYDLIMGVSVSDERQRLLKTLSQLKVEAQWVVALNMSDSWLLPEELAKQGEISLNHNTLSKISIENNKPQRLNEGSAILQVQLTSSWSQANLNVNKEEVIEVVKTALASIFGKSYSITASYAHRWLYSQIDKSLAADKTFLTDENGLYIAGDFANSQGEGVERAWVSGNDVAEQILKITPMTLEPLC